MGRQPLALRQEGDSGGKITKFKLYWDSREGGLNGNLRICSRSLSRWTSFRPETLKEKLQKTKVKVMLLIGDEESDWKQFTMSQFLKGYSEKDAIYDDL